MDGDVGFLADLPQSYYILGGIVLAGAAYWFYEYINSFSPFGPIDPNNYPVVPLQNPKLFRVQYGLWFPQATQIYAKYINPTNPDYFSAWLNGEELSIFNNWKQQYPNQASWPYNDFYPAIINWYNSKRTTFQEKVTDY
jgi:hypothetical protein